LVNSLDCFLGGSLFLYTLLGPATLLGILLWVV
jgi:hypothetical protein